MTECHPVIAIRVKKAVRKGAKLIVADPRRTTLANLAHRYLPIRLGSDSALALAMANVIIAEDLVDHEFIKTRTRGFEEIKEHVKNFTPEWAEKITEVSADEIRTAAREYATAERAGIYWTLGVTEHICGVGNVQSMCNLALLTGNLGKPSAGVNPLRGQNNIQGAGDCGALPHRFPAQIPVEDDQHRAKLEKLWGVTLSPKAGITKIRALDEAVNKNIRAMWIMGENTLTSDPNQHHTAKAFKSLDFLVVQDIFLTETAKAANVVFPAAGFGEVDGTFTNSERRVQRVRKAVEPPGEAKPDIWIIGQVAKYMGSPVKMLYKDVGEVFDEIAEVSPLYHGISYKRIDERGIQWPCPDKEHPGTPYLHKDKFKNDRGVFKLINYVDPAEMPDKDYPFFFTTGRRLATYHTNTQTGRAKGFKTLVPNEWLEMNPKDAAIIGVNTGDLVKLISRRGDVQVKIKVTRKSPPGTLFASFAFGEESPINRVTSNAVDPATETPEYKVCAVRVEKL